MKRAYPQYEFSKDDAVWDILSEIYESEDNAQFVFVLDEWDYIFHRDFVTEGILPIAKYSSGSELNMFLEYTMVTEELFSTYFGFTETEVDELYIKYRKNCSEPKVSRECCDINEFINPGRNFFGYGGVWFPEL